MKQVWAREGSYAWACEQFKSMRQDATVQQMRDKCVRSCCAHAGAGCSLIRAPRVARTGWR